MAWNEPGGNGKDPWDSGGPPDLEAILKKFGGRFRRGGGAGGGAGGGGAGAGGGAPFPAGMAAIVAAVVVLVWLFSGFYTVQPAERAVVLQFGKYLTVAGEGLHWRVPWPVQTVETVNVDGIRNMTDRQIMLTEDENIVDVELAVQYRVSSAEDYLFRVRDPDLTLRHALKSALREVVGKNKMDFILTAGREEVAERTKLLLQDTLDGYQTGLVVTEVNIKDAQPPESVQGAFADAIKAREDEQRLINEAEAYSNDILPRARGTAARMVAEANGYQTRIEEEAIGDASRFKQLLAEYERAPQVTRDRMYLETMRDVMGRASKVLIDVDKSAPLLYLPLDKLVGKRGVEGDASYNFNLPPATAGGSNTTRSSGSNAATRGGSRERGRR